MLGSALMDDFVALHMTWGAANELSTLTSYQRLIAQTEHPELIDLLNAIIKDERRHFAFYRAQARLRLARSAWARRLTRWAMEHLWAIVGTGFAHRARQTSSSCICSATRRARRPRSTWIGRWPSSPAWGMRDLPACSRRRAWS